MFSTKRRLLEEQIARGKRVLEESGLNEMEEHAYVLGLIRKPSRIQILKDCLASQEADPVITH